MSQVAFRRSYSWILHPTMYLKPNLLVRHSPPQSMIFGIL